MQNTMSLDNVVETWYLYEKIHRLSSYLLTSCAFRGHATALAKVKTFPLNTVE